MFMVLSPLPSKTVCPKAGGATASNKIKPKMKILQNFTRSPKGFKVHQNKSLWWLGET